tara:strand:- start:3598 stop:3810 length:213 start_codon:yes stop_codon:yes gene_type:complete
VRLSQNLLHQEDVTQYSKLLEEKVRGYQSRYPAHLKDEYSGGYATLGSCLVEFQSILEEQPKLSRGSGLH